MSGKRNPDRKPSRKRNLSAQVPADRALVRDLAPRLADLERDLKHAYMPALRRLMAAAEPGANAVLNELEEGAGGGGFLGAMEWLRHDVAGYVFAGGDRDLYAFWQYTRGRDESVTEAEAFRDIGEQADDPVAELERFRRGRAKAARGLGR